MNDQPTGPALEDFRRQRQQQRDSRAAAEAYDKARTYPETPTSPKTEKKAKGGSVKSSASRRADGIAQRGKTKGRMI